MKRKGVNKAMALLTTLLVLILLMAVIVTLSSFSQLEVKKTINHYTIMNARHSSESGLFYGKYLLNNASLGSVSTVETVLNSLANEMASALNGSSALGGQTIHRGGDGNLNVIIPPMSSGSGTFSITFRPLTVDDSSDEEYRASHIIMESTGIDEETSRTTSLAMAIVASPANHPIMVNGVATNGTFLIQGSSSIIGLNDPQEGSVYMTVMDPNDPLLLTLKGTSKISGDIYAINPDAYVDTGNQWQSTSIGGAYGLDIPAHVHTGVEPFALPEIDTSAIINSVSLTTVNSNQSGQVNLSNIRIPANSNIRITGSVQLNGLIYIESPNDIFIGGDVSVTGIMVTEEDTTGSSKIEFGGGNMLHPVTDLPDTTQYLPLKQFAGTALIAKGYEVTFSGNTVSVGGMMAADNFIFKGYGNMTLKGGLLIYGTGCCELRGNQTIIIDKSDMEGLPPGFLIGGGGTGSTTLSVEPDGYMESQ